MMREKLFTLRVVKLKLSQEKMGEKLGYSRNHYANIENGTHGVTLKFLNALCNAFGMSLKEAEELTQIEEQSKKNDGETG